MLWNLLLQRHSVKHQTGRLQQTGLSGIKEGKAEQKKATMNSTASEIQIKSCSVATGKTILPRFIRSKCIQAPGPATCFVCCWHEALSPKVHNISVRNDLFFFFSKCLHLSQKATLDENSISSLPLRIKFLYGVHKHFNNINKFSLTEQSLTDQRLSWAAKKADGSRQGVRRVPALSSQAPWHRMDRERGNGCHRQEESFLKQFPTLQCYQSLQSCHKPP